MENSTTLNKDLLDKSNHATSKSNLLKPGIDSPGSPSLPLNNQNKSPNTRKDGDRSSTLPPNKRTFSKNKGKEDESINHTFRNPINKINTTSKASSKKNKNNTNTNKEKFSSQTPPSIKESIKAQTKKDEKKMVLESKKIIIDPITTIFTRIAKAPTKLSNQHFILYLIATLIGFYHWIFLFETSSKMERNYCFSKMNQFEACSISQICRNYESKRNIFIYNNSIEVTDKKLRKHQKFLEENRLVNNYYKPFFLRDMDLLSNNKIFNKLQMTSTIYDKINFVIVLTKKEEWNVFLRYCSLCEKEKYFMVMVIMDVAGGLIGALLFGIISDIYGRKKVIQITLFISLLFSAFLCGYFFWLDIFRSKFMGINSVDYELGSNYKNFKEILNEIVAQEKMNRFFNSYFFFCLMCIFMLSLCVYPLTKTCLCLVLENSISDLQVLINFRKFTFLSRGVPPFLTCILLQFINSFKITAAIGAIGFFIFFVLSIMFFKESMRYYYEYWELENLTNLIFNSFTLNDVSFNYLDRDELYLKLDNKKYTTSIGKYRTKDTYYNEFNEQIKSLIRKIKRNTFFIIKKEDVVRNPMIIISTHQSNRMLEKSKYLLLSVFILTYLIIYSIDREMIKKPFSSESGTFFRFAIFAIINLISNYFYYFLYRITCFKTVIIISSIIISILSVTYHFVTSSDEDTPLDLLQYNFGMLDNYRRDNLGSGLTTFMYFIHFLLNGIEFYYYLLIIKISKTIYRGLIFAEHSVMLLISSALAEGFHSQIQRPFFFLGVINLLCLLTFTFVNESKKIPYLVNDLKIYSQEKKENIDKFE